MSGAPTTGAAARPGGPLVVACLRIADLRTAVDPLTGSVTSDPWGMGLTAADAAALEIALQLAGTWSGRVVALSAGPPRIESVLRDVAGLGVDVVRVDAPEPDGTGAGSGTELAAHDPGLATALLAALEPFGPPDLVLCGDRSVDRGTGTLPAELAHLLGAAQALGLVAVAAAGDGGGGGGGDRALTGERRLDGGWRERLRVPLPAVCSVEGAGIRLRRASLAGALHASGLAVDVTGGMTGDMTAGAAVGGGTGTVRAGAVRPFLPRTRVVAPPEGDDPRLRLLTLTGALVDHEHPTVVGPVGAAEAADALLSYLDRHGVTVEDRP